jgi:hypothetical protein
MLHTLRWFRCSIPRYQSSLEEKNIRLHGSDVYRPERISTPGEETSNRYLVLVNRQKHFAKEIHEVICTMISNMHKTERFNSLVRVASSVIRNNSVLSSSNGSTNPNSDIYFPMRTSPQHQKKSPHQEVTKQTHHLLRRPPRMQLLQILADEVRRRLEPRVARRVRRQPRGPAVRVEQNGRVALRPEGVRRVRHARRQPVGRGGDVLHAIRVRRKEVRGACQCKRGRVRVRVMIREVGGQRRLVT